MLETKTVTYYYYLLFIPSCSRTTVVLVAGRSKSRVYSPFAALWNQVLEQKQVWSLTACALPLNAIASSPVHSTVLLPTPEQRCAGFLPASKTMNVRTYSNTRVPFFFICRHVALLSKPSWNNSSPYPLPVQH